MKRKRATQERWTPGKPIPSFATAAKEERFWLTHHFDDVMEAGGEPVAYEPQATGNPGTHVRREPRSGRK